MGVVIQLSCFFFLPNLGGVRWFMCQSSLFLIVEKHVRHEMKLEVFHLFSKMRFCFSRIPVSLNSLKKCRCLGFVLDVWPLRIFIVPHLPSILQPVATWLHLPLLPFKTLPNISSSFLSLRLCFFNPTRASPENFPYNIRGIMLDFIHRLLWPLGFSWRIILTPSHSRSWHNPSRISCPLPTATFF